MTNIRALQAVGTIVVGLVTLLSALYGGRYPWLAALAVIVSGIIGTLLGTPIPPVVRSAFASMPPAKQAELTVQAVASMPPAARQEVLDKIVFLASDRPPPAEST